MANEFVIAGFKDVADGLQEGQFSVGTRKKANTLNDSKKAKSLLGVTLRCVDDTIRDVVESSIELGIITPKLK